MHSRKVNRPGQPGQQTFQGEDGHQEEPRAQDLNVADCERKSDIPSRQLEFLRGLLIYGGVRQ